MAKARFKQVDVFTDKPFLGNPVAVVIGGEELSTEQMQRIGMFWLTRQNRPIRPLCLREPTRLVQGDCRIQKLCHGWIRHRSGRILQDQRAAPLRAGCAARRR